MPTASPTACKPGHRLHAVESPTSRTRWWRTEAGSERGPSWRSAAIAPAVSIGVGAPQINGSPYPQMNCGGPIVVVVVGRGAAAVVATVALFGLADVTLGVAAAVGLAAEVDVHDVNAANTNATHARLRRRAARLLITPQCCTHDPSE